MATNLRNTLLRLHTFNRHTTSRKMSITSVVLNSAQAQPNEKTLTIPQPDGEEKVYSPKLEQIFQSISQLNLLEVSQLSELLKKRLNLPDAPMMAAAMTAPAHVAATSGEEETPQVVQTSFNLKLVKYDDKQKIPLIRELKNLFPDMNLVQAKKFIESAPVVVMKEIGKDEAEKVKELLTKAGGDIVIE